MSHGGPREGSGRPRKADKYALAIATAEDRIADRLPELVDKLFELAEGVEVERRTSHGPKVYSEPPSFKAIEHLLNRVMGKPVQPNEHSGPDGEPIEVTVAARVVAAAELELWRKEMTERLALSNLPSAPPTPRTLPISLESSTTPKG